MTQILGLLAMFSSRESPDSHRMDYTAITGSITGATISVYPGSADVTVSTGTVDGVKFYMAESAGTTLQEMQTDSAATFTVDFTTFAAVADVYGQLTGTTPVAEFSADIVCQLIGPDESVWVRDTFTFQP